MAITFPRSLPSWFGAANQSLFLARKGFSARTHAGQSIFYENGPALWRHEVQTMDLSPAQFAEMRAFLYSLRGGARYYKAGDVLRSLPQAYETALPGGWNGIATAVDVDVDTVTINATAARAGFVITVGDMLTITNSTGDMLHVVTEGVTLNGSGVGAVSVEPAPLDNIYSAGDSVHLKDPWAQFSVDNATIRVHQSQRYNSISWAATQRII